MDWIQTYTGKQFRVRAPKSSDFDIRDIAHSLSLQCRFNGHCNIFYSVAEHSVRVSKLCSSEFALWGLLHDLAEAYIGDLPRPIKTFLPEFDAIEEKILLSAKEAFGLSWPMPKEVKIADDILLATEARDIMGPHVKSWHLSQKALKDFLYPMSSIEAEKAFLDRFEELSRK